MKLLTAILLLVCALATVLAVPVATPPQVTILRALVPPSSMQRVRRSPTHKFKGLKGFGGGGGFGGGFGGGYGGGGYPSYGGGGYPSHGGGGCNVCGGGGYPSGGSTSWSSAQASASSGSSSWGKK